MNGKFSEKKTLDEQEQKKMIKEPCTTSDKNFDRGQILHTWRK